MTPHTAQINPDSTDPHAGGEIPPPGQSVTLARAAARAGDVPEAYRRLAQVADEDGPYVAWASAAALMSRLARQQRPAARRTVRVAVASSYTTAQLAALLRVAALRRGIDVVIHEAPFAAYAQEILDGDSDLHAFAPDYVLIAPHAGIIPFPWQTDDPERLLDAEIDRWQGLWESVRVHSHARVIQHNVVVPVDTPWGHVAGRLPGSRDEMLRTLNTRLAQVAGDDVLIVDCDRVAAGFGKARWFDDRYWHLSKQAVALDALPGLARHTAALLAAAEGLSAKCVVVDLDNTLWGGTIAEDGLAGIQLGHGHRGEAHIAFQEYLLALRARGILLAVVSKNTEADARAPFERHPDMRLALSDFAVFLANWSDKASNLTRVADELGIGVDALVFVDDSPAEREVIRRLVPEAEVVALGSDPAGYVRALSQTLLFESATVTPEDLVRAEQYRARAAAHGLKRRSGTLEDFYLGLEMEATVDSFDELDLARIVQLIARTNQFRLSPRRHGLAELRTLMDDERAVTLSLRLRDRYGDHGLVAALIARQEGTVLEIDTWLMSCRVIGRTVEDEMLATTCRIALARGCDRISATFVPTDRNEVVRGSLERLGFCPGHRAADGRGTWIYDIVGKGVPVSEYIASSPDELAAA